MNALAAIKSMVEDVVDSKYFDLMMGDHLKTTTFLIIPKCKVKHDHREFITLFSKYWY